MAFEQSIDIAARPAELFALSQDYRRRLEWDPFLRSAALVSGATVVAVGVRAYCVSWSGLGMETAYVSFRPPHVTAVKMTRGPWFIERFAGSWRFAEIAPGVTRVRFRYYLRARPRILAPLLNWVFTRDTSKRLAAFKSAVETGLILDRPF